METHPQIEPKSTISKEAVEWLEKTRDTWTREWGVHRLTWPEEILAALDGPEPAAGGGSVETSALDEPECTCPQGTPATMGSDGRVECDRCGLDATVRAENTQKPTSAREWWISLERLGNGNLSPESAAFVNAQQGGIIHVREVLPQSAGSLEQKGMPFAEMMAGQEALKFLRIFESKLRHTMSPFATNMLDMILASGGTTSEEGKAPAPEPIAIPQKRQPDDVPRAEVSASAMVWLRKEAFGSSFGAWAREIYRALPTNAEAQAPVSAEALKWLSTRMAQVPGTKGYYYMAEILTALRTLGATPAQTKP